MRRFRRQEPDRSSVLSGTSEDENKDIEDMIPRLATIPDDEDVEMSAPPVPRKRSRPSRDDEKVSPSRTNKRRRTGLASPVRSRVLNWTSIPGAIVRIKLKNVLCHAHFEFEFHPQINIISGANGSGKSAIEAAISLALGCNARQTARGASINDIIRFGQDAGEIRLWLNNSGGEAHPQYGDTILIERKLRRTAKSGSATWKIFDAEGMHEVGRSSKTVRNLCDHFGYRISNPCVILKQDAAKQFLNSSKAKDKFKFFMDASNLSEHEKELEDCRDKVTMAEHNVHEAEAAQSAIVEAFQSAERTYQQYQYVQEAEQKIDVLERAVKWKKFRHYEHRMQTAEQEYAKSQELLQTTQRRFTEEKAKFDGDNERVINQDVENKELTDKIESIDADLRKSQKIYQASLDGLRKHKQRIKAVEREVQQTDVRIRKKHKEIEQITSNAGANGQELRQRFELRERINTDLATAREKLSEAKEQAMAANHVDEIANKQREIDTYRDSIKRLKDQQHEARQSLRGLSGRNDNSVDRFAVGGRGRNAASTTQILSEIERHRRRFKMLPIGPLGQYIQLKEGAQDYVQQIMGAFGGNLFSFVCDNMRDRDCLISLGRNLNANLKVIVRKAPGGRGRHNVPGNPCARDWPNVPRIIDLVEISDDWAFNSLVDMSSPENIFIHGSLEETREFYNQVEQRGLRNQVRGVYTTGGDLFLVQKKGRTMASYPVKEQRPVLASDTRSQEEYYNNLIRNMDGELKGFEKDCRACAQHATRLRKEQEKAQKALQISTRKIGQLEQKLDKVNTDIESLEEENKNEDDEKVEIQGIEEDIQELEREKQEKRDRIAELNRDSEMADGHTEELKNDRDRCAEKLDAAKDELVAWQDQLQTMMSSVQESRKKVKLFERAIAKADAKVKESEEKLVPLQEKLDKANEEAKECGDDPTPNNRSLARKKIQSLLGEIRGTREQAEIMQKNLPDGEEIVSRYNEAKEPYEQHMTRVHTAKSNLESYRQQLYERQSLYDQLKEQTAVSVSEAFRSIMNRQGHTGTININFDEDELSIEVLMMGHESQKSLQQRAELSQSRRNADLAKTVNTKTLSGGERSFTQLSLIMALQEFTQSPFCIYDEFDVFMDDVNRGNSIAQLIKTAQTTQRQYIFITPNDITPMFKNEAEMKCIRLHPPRD